MDSSAPSILPSNLSLHCEKNENKLKETEFGSFWPIRGIIAITHNHLNCAKSFGDLNPAVKLFFLASKSSLKSNRHRNDNQNGSKML